jgi:hypothetical protein
MDDFAVLHDSMYATMMCDRPLQSPLDLGYAILYSSHLRQSQAPLSAIRVPFVERIDQSGYHLSSARWE